MRLAQVIWYGTSASDTFAIRRPALAAIYWGKPMW